MTDTKQEEYVVCGPEGSVCVSTAEPALMDDRGPVTKLRETSASEALYGFAAWLTTRFDQVTFSQHNDSAVALDLVERFRKLNGWPEPREGWEELIEMPELIETQELRE